ncbi:putative protein OS=Streptomyces aurantiogriseus OX=66870 GN=GCM10010251_34040 PE=4 SV=1 [Streptomyces aurantiogriseus]
MRRERVVVVRLEPVAQLVTANSDCGSRQPYAQHATGSPHRHDPDPPTGSRRDPHHHTPDPPTNPQAHRSPPPAATYSAAVAFNASHSSIRTSGSSSERPRISSTRRIR